MVTFTTTSSQELLERTIDKFWETIPPLWNHIKGNLRSIATDQFGISVEQFHILRHIRRGLGSVSELANVRQISRPAISQAVDVLVDKGLILRCQSDADRRYIRLELTPDGDHLLNAIFEKNRAWMASKLTGLSPEESEHIIQALDLLKLCFDEEQA